MDIRTLRYFLAVAKEESITRAARALHMSQPPLSRQLKDLEEELGCQLFIRGPKKITLTEEGRLLRRRAEELISLADKTKAELTGTSDGIRGEVWIGAGETLGMAVLARAAAKLHAAHPEIRFSMFSGDAAAISDKLDNGIIDFGLFVGKAEISRYDSMRLPVSDTWSVLMRKDSPLAEKEMIHAEDLWDKPLFLSRQAASSGELRAWLGRDVAEIDVVLLSDLIYNASLFVKENMGYAVTLDGLINTTGASDLCYRPLYPPISAELVLAWKKYQSRSRASEAFLDVVRHECSLTGQK